MDPEGTPLLQVCELSIDYGDAPGAVRAVDSVSLSIARGESVGLLGASGSGKTSLALAIPGLLSRRARVSGSVRFAGGELLGLPERELEPIRGAGAGIGVIYQEPELALNPVLKVGTQIRHVICAHRARVIGDPQALAIRVLTEAGFGPEADRILDSYPHQLSGGQRQRVLIAQALAADPDLLIADEPTASVDAAIQTDVLGLLRRLQQTRRLALLFISHSPTVLAAIADRVSVLSAGRIVEEGPADRVLLAPAHPCTRSLVDATRPRLSRSGFSSGAPIRPLAEIRGLTKTYTRRRRLFGGGRVVTALGGVDLTIPADSTVGLVGPSGSGKSTLARCLARLDEADAGEILFNGVDVRRLRDAALRRFRREVQVIVQDPAGALNPRFSAEAIVAEPLAVQRIGDARERRARALELIAEVGLPVGRANDPPESFSGGERQRLAIARALALEPSLLVLDEAFSGIDLPVQRQILELVARLRERRGFACLVISHDLALVNQIADRVVVMREGSIVESAAVAEPLRRYA
jgi:peptide/nickel transport system ATP-binding protein